MFDNQLTNSLIKIGPSGARVEGGYEGGELPLEHEVVLPGLAGARAAAAARAAHRL